MCFNKKYNKPIFLRCHVTFIQCNEVSYQINVSSELMQVLQGHKFDIQKDASSNPNERAYFT